MSCTCSRTFARVCQVNVVVGRVRAYTFSHRWERSLKEIPGILPIHHGYSFSYYPSSLLLRAGGGMNLLLAAAELTHTGSSLDEPHYYKEFRAELGADAHLCLLHTKESFGRTFDQASPPFVSSVCATQCQELLFWVLFGSVQSLLSHGHPDEVAVTFGMLPSDW